MCRACFFKVFEDEVHETIVTQKLFKPGERVAIAASGGKDSTVLAHVMTTLNARHAYGLELYLLSVDEGISGYRDDSLATVARNKDQYHVPLEVVSYKQLYGWSMDDIVKQIGTKNNCTFCGVFRRQALDRGAVISKADKIATGHNADDIGETVLLNILRGDVPRLSRTAAAMTGADSGLPRVKPLRCCYEKEIVMYAYFNKLDYFSTECVYAPFAARGFARDFVKDLEAARPSAILGLLRSAETMRFEQRSMAGLPQPGKCGRCGYISSQPVCKACVLLEGLNRGLPGLGVSRTRGTKTQRAGLPKEVAESHQSSPTPADDPTGTTTTTAVSTTQTVDSPRAQDPLKAQSPWQSPSGDLCGGASGGGVEAAADVAVRLGSMCGAAEHGQVVADGKASVPHAHEQLSRSITTSGNQLRVDIAYED